MRKCTILNVRYVVSLGVRKNTIICGKSLVKSHSCLGCEDKKGTKISLLKTVCLLVDTFSLGKHHCNSAPLPNSSPIFCATRKDDRKRRKFSSVNQIFFAFS